MPGYDFGLSNTRMVCNDEQVLKPQCTVKNNKKLKKPRLI